MSKKNLFVISAPLQLINAVEAIHHFKCSQNILVLIYNSVLNSQDYQQKINSLNSEDWDDIMYYDLGKIAKKKRFFEQVKLIKKLKEESYHYLFPGDFGTIQQAIMANVNVENIYLLDDGTASITIYEKLKNKKFFSNYTLPQKLKLLRYKLVKLKYRIEQDINFFTIYNLKSLEHIHVIQNDYLYLKQTQLTHTKEDKNIYILGQKLVDINWITEKKYLEYIEKIAQKLFFKYSTKVIYKPHRSETITPAYKKLINENFIIDEDISQGSIEAFFINENVYPTVVASFFSSALFTLNKIFEKTEIYSIIIDDNDLTVDKNTWKLIQKAYSFLADEDIIFIDDIIKN